MANSSKRKGNGFERELVNEAKDRGIPAKRAYASNGLSLGLTEGVDCLIGNYAAQAKRRAKIAQYMQPDSDVDIQIIREDYGESLVVMRYDEFLNLITKTSDQ